VGRWVADADDHDNEASVPRDEVACRTAGGDGVAETPKAAGRRPEYRLG